MSIGVCLKWVDRRPEVRHGVVADIDVRFAGISAADQSALELALLAGAAWGHAVVAVTAGPAEAACVLRDAYAVGVTRAVHVLAPPTAESATVARVLAPALRGCITVFCGDYSVDRGTGAVPAMLAAELGAAQALGLVSVELGADAELVALRRLDGGRRERLGVNGPAVVSVEGGVAPLRRASLAASLAAGRQEIEQIVPALDHGEPHRFVHPYRPRARVLPAPSGATALERVAVLTDAGGTPKRNEVITLTPSEAAHRILETLADWGYPAR